MSVPKLVRDRVKSALWEQADKLDWDSLGSAQKAQHYTNWTESEAIGRTLAAYMDPRAVRVYIKDTLLKSYSREKLNAHQALVLRLAGHVEGDISEAYIKPHGLRFSDGSLIAWGRADDWKSVLGSLFERGFGHEGGRRAVVLFKSSPRFVGAAARRLVQTAASRLGIDGCTWFD